MSGHGLEVELKGGPAKPSKPSELEGGPAKRSKSSAIFARVSAVVRKLEDAEQSLRPSRLAAR